MPMSSSESVRPIRLPPSNFDGLKVPRTLQKTRQWFRVHQAQYPAIFFSLNSAHRFSHEDCRYRFLYLAADVDTCLFERFGDRTYDQEMAIAQSLWETHCVSAVQVPDVPVCDLTNAKTLSVLRVDLSALMHSNLSTPQNWGKAIQSHPSEFQGIKFKSRFNGKACLALFARDRMEEKLKETSLGTLSENDQSVDWLAKHKVTLY
jgi:hypothetical protein